VRIHFDWRLARVIDSDGNVIDELVWSDKRSVGALADRLAELQSGRLSPEARVLAERFSEGEPNHLGAMSDPDWPEPDGDEQALLAESTDRLARRGVADAAGDRPRQAPRHALVCC